MRALRLFRGTEHGDGVPPAALSAELAPGGSRPQAPGPIAASSCLLLPAPTVPGWRCLAPRHSWCSETATCHPGVDWHRAERLGCRGSVPEGRQRDPCRKAPCGWVHGVDPRDHELLRLLIHHSLGDDHGIFAGRIHP